jgi:hypothetical protein
MLNTYDYMRVHKRGVNLNFAVLQIQLLHKELLVVMYMYGGPLKHVQYNLCTCIGVSLDFRV